MPRAATEAVVHGEGGTIKVGTTGTIGSLMTRELDAVKVAPPPPAAAGHPRLRRHQGCPVSVPCGAATPRKTVLRKSSSDISGGSRADRVSAEDACCKPRRVSRRNTFDSPMLRSDGALVDVRTPSGGRAKKKGGVYGVELVDVKCGNPMTSRLRKLGFCKLSETFA
jgi:hypothetical protein